MHKPPTTRKQGRNQWRKGTEQCRRERKYSWPLTYLGPGCGEHKGPGPPTCCEREQVELSASMKHLHYFLLMIDLLCYGWQSLLMWFDLWGKGLDINFCPAVLWAFWEKKKNILWWYCQRKRMGWLKLLAHMRSILVLPVAPSTANRRTGLFIIQQPCVELAHYLHWCFSNVFLIMGLYVTVCRKKKICLVIKHGNSSWFRVLIRDLFEKTKIPEEECVPTPLLWGLLLSVWQHGASSPAEQMS